MSVRSADLDRSGDTARRVTPRREPTRLESGPSALLQLQRTAGNAAVSRMMIQRWKHLGLGNPGVHTIGTGGMLWHGTDIQKFQDRSPGALPGKTSTKPSPPAWFAGDPAFSAHVSAFMHPSHTTYMNAYTVQKHDLKLLAFDDIADLNAYIGLPANTANDNNSAALVLARAGNIDGYMLEADAVRGDPEYILFANGLAKLKREDQLAYQEKETRWDQGPGDDRSRKHTFHGQHMGTLSGINYTY